MGIHPECRRCASGVKYVIPDERGDRSPRRQSWRPAATLSTSCEVAADGLDAAHGERDEALVEGRRLRRHLGDLDSVLRIREHVLTVRPDPAGERGTAAPHVPLAAVVGFDAREPGREVARVPGRRVAPFEDVPNPVGRHNLPPIAPVAVREHHLPFSIGREPRHQLACVQDTLPLSFPVVESACRART